MANLKRSLKHLFDAKHGVALPATFLILLVSTLSIVSFTYYFAVERVNSQGQTLKVSTAKQNLLSLDQTVVSTLWQPGSSATYDLTDSGGLTNIQPLNNTLSVTVADGKQISETIFSSTVGQVTYQLPYSSSSETGLYLKGDSRTITNQSGASMSQLSIEQGAQHPEIDLRYRPSVTYAVTGVEAGKTEITIRVYILNLNSSQPIDSQGELPLQISCLNTQLTSKTLQVPYTTDNLAVTCILNGASGSVSIPLVGSTNGATITIETVVCNVSIQRCTR